MIENLNQIELLQTLKKKIKSKKENISFIQIGVNDGITHDTAFHILEPNDCGIFIEPIKKIFDVMVENKKEFNSSLFLNVAVLPKKLEGNTKMTILSHDDLNQGSSLVNVNSGRIIEQVEVSVTSVHDLLKENNIKDLDILFCDAEGVDFLIIDDFLDYIEPEVMFFETCGWWCEEDTKILSTNGSITQIPSRKSFKTKLENLNYYVIDYYENEINKSQDMIAIKLKYV